MEIDNILGCGNQRYHLTCGPRRTTVSLDNHLSLLLSLKLGYAPESPQAQRAVRHWLQARLDESGDYNRWRLSQWLGEEVIRALVSDDVKKLYNHWLGEWIDRGRSARQQASTIALAPTTENS